MKRKLLLLTLFVASLSACNMKTYTRDDAPMLFEALDTRPNGYKGSIGTDALFEITGTKASPTLLCRSVKVATNEGKSDRQYCKIKGGEWRQVMVDHTQETWALSGDGHIIYARCPKYFAAILHVVLNGWSISKADANYNAQLAVAFTNGGYSIDSVVLSQPEQYDEVIDGLNEFLVNLAYIVLRKYRNARLIHCAAYENKGEAHLIVAQKNQGKSTLIYQKACSGDQVLADDLLIWLPKTAEFVCLGLPIRLRRPVLGLDGKAADPDSFFAGNGIAYSKSGVFSIAPFGKRVLLDHIWQIKRDYRPDKIPIYKAAQTLNDFLIGPEFSEKRKDKVN